MTVTRHLPLSANCPSLFRPFRLDTVRPKVDRDRNKEKMRRKRNHNYLRRCRKARGFTQKEVAWILGLESSSMISRWEKGVSLPETINAIKICVVYETTVDFVFQELRDALVEEIAERLHAVQQTRGDDDEV